jgi:glycosyltransferase involved in cell wall biosynthesis
MSLVDRSESKRPRIIAAKSNISLPNESQIRKYPDLSMSIRVAVLSPISWRTPPRHYGPWEYVVNLLTEGLVQLGLDVTLFATGDSQTSGKLVSVCPRPYSEDPSVNAKVAECLHIAEVFERSADFDLIHNHFDFLPLTYSGLTDTPVLTTIHGFSSPSILPVYEKYNGRSHYVAISEADKSPALDYIATIHHGIDVAQFPFCKTHGEYLLFFGRIHPEKGVYEAIQVAQRVGIKLIIAGIIQDQDYYHSHVEPYLDGDAVEYVGAVGPMLRAEVLGRALALLHLISFDEPFGLSMVESLACGTPVIAFGRGSIPEIIKHGETGYVVAGIEDAVEAVAAIPSLDRATCRKDAEERFANSRMASDYVRVYREILELEAEDEQ